LVAVEVAVAFFGCVCCWIVEVIARLDRAVVAVAAAAAAAVGFFPETVAAAAARPRDFDACDTAVAAVEGAVAVEATDIARDAGREAVWWYGKGSGIDKDSPAKRRCEIRDACRSRDNRCTSSA
jgi:hypothetical protein